MNAYYLLIIVGTLVGFCGLAYLLLAPIWRFLDREKKVSSEWTKEALARRRRRQGNGHSSGDAAPSESDSAPDEADNAGEAEDRPPPGRSAGKR